jgi:hypothetical protein
MAAVLQVVAEPSHRHHAFLLLLLSPRRSAFMLLLLLLLLLLPLLLLSLQGQFYTFGRLQTAVQQTACHGSRMQQRRGATCTRGTRVQMRWL